MPDLQGEAMTANGYDAASIVKRYIELRDYVQNETKSFKARMKEFTDAMELIEGMAAAMMKETKQSALSTEFGTAFPVTKNRVTCEDREAFLDFVRQSQAWNFLTSHVAKEAVDDWMAQNEGRIPPGLKIEGYTEIQFRKA
ncbi:MAG TPA: hypothetical protein VF748_14935 [Candidatus Acidoferrum sp.]